MKKQHYVDTRFEIVEIVVNGKQVDLTNYYWDDKTAEGLSRFVNKVAPNWQKATIRKRTTVFDLNNPVLKHVEKKPTVLNVCAAEYFEPNYTRINRDFTKNGKISQHILSFFGEMQK